MPPEDPTDDELFYLLHHVFLPPKLPQEEDLTTDHEAALCRAAYNASKKFVSFLDNEKQAEWGRVSKMLKMFLKTTRAPDKAAMVQDILLLAEGECFVFNIRAHNAALTIQRKGNVVVYSAFEVSPLPLAVMSTEGKLIRSFPGPAVQLSLDIALNENFVEQLVSYLIHMDGDPIDAGVYTEKAGSKVHKPRETNHPRYITQLLMMILRGLGDEADIQRFTKRVSDDVCWQGALKPWRRSGLWLIIRVAVQLMVATRDTYKAFVIFFQMELLKLMLKKDFPSELIHVARVKTARRIYKMRQLSRKLLTNFQTTSKTIHDHLQARWTAEQAAQSRSPTYTHDPSTIEASTSMKLTASRQYLEKVLRPQAHSRRSTLFIPPKAPRLRDVQDFSTIAGGGLAKALEADQHTALVDFEWLIENHLEEWLRGSAYNEATSKTLARCMDQYYKAAKDFYADIPESLSVMLLTVMELWVGMDKVAVKHMRDLDKYSPEIPVNFLDSLLIRRAKSIRRVEAIEAYLRQRHEAATIDTSVFSSEPTASSFSVRYYASSNEMKQLRRDIEDKARQDREKKKAELIKANAVHASLKEERDALLRCDFIVFHDTGRSVHSHWCQRCALNNRMSSMSIEVHEWPLPTKPHQAEAICFELRCPEVYSFWRSRTYMILRDLGASHAEEDVWSPKGKLEEYDGLSNWRDSRYWESGRLRLGSSVMTFGRTHFHSVPIPAEVKSVCVNHGADWRLYDAERGEEVMTEWEDNVNLDKYCTLKIPKIDAEDGKKGPYADLQYAVTKTTHSHNETIARQGDCPPSLNLHEYLAFTNLRCGGNLQWLNIARELRTNVLTFSREEVHILLMQAAWQLGPSVIEMNSSSGQVSGGAWKRAWHRELEEPEFGMVLIREARELLKRVEANWMEGVTVKTIIYLISRLLASIGSQNNQTHQHVCQEGYALLFEARKITRKWMREIVSKLQSAPNDKESAELQTRACEMACICRATYDVDPESRLNDMLSTEDDVAVFLECAIVVHDNSPSLLTEKSAKSGLPQSHSVLTKMLHRDKRLSLMLEPKLRSVLSQRALDNAISAIWSGFHSSGEDDKCWSILPKPQDQWLTTETSPPSGQQAQHVHFNMLDGRLLVDGKPLGRLPKEIVEHDTYKRIFGQKIFDVIPGDMPGMDYATRSLVHGHQIFFSIRNDNRDLIIRARTPEGEVYEHIPYTNFLEDFPKLYALEYVHWMNVRSAEIEFRPTEKSWERSDQNWHLLFHQDGQPSRMVLRTAAEVTYLVDIHSSMFKGIAKKLRPLEVDDYVTITVDSQTHIVTVDLPRFRLAFFVNGLGILESKNMLGMVVDPDQHTGTMIGLYNQLVLCHKDPAFAALPRSRCVLIPHGHVHWLLTEEKHHVRVYIDTVPKSHFARHVTWYKYEVDTELGYLIGNVQPASRLFKIYLHALCSHPLPDPLTHQTGTEHALQELAGAASFSFQKLTQAEVELLKLIGNLTPKRSYHTPHEKSMQKTAWVNLLPALSQHGGFYLTVKKILNHAGSLAMFNSPKAGTEPDLRFKTDTEAYLMDRAMHRAAIYYEISSLLQPSGSFDRTYSARDSPHDGEHDPDGIEAMKIARLVFCWSPGLTRHLASGELIQLFKYLGALHGPTRDILLEYKPDWQQQNLTTSWITLYGHCREFQGESKRFTFAFLFGFLAYTKRLFRKWLPIFLAIAMMQSASSPPPPQHSSYDLSAGFQPSEDHVRKIIKDGAHKLPNTPAASCEQLESEGHQQWANRKETFYNESIDRRTERIMHSAMLREHSSDPNWPFAEPSDGQWFDVPRIKARLNSYFSSCNRNAALRQFSQQVTIALQAINHTPSMSEVLSRFQFIPRFDVSSRPPIPLTLENLLNTRKHLVPSFMEQEFGVGAPTLTRLTCQSRDTHDLKALLHRFRRNATSNLAPLYSARLENSRQQLNNQKQVSMPSGLPTVDSCVAYQKRCSTRSENVFASLHSVLAPLDCAAQVLEYAGLWPRIHSRTLLHALASTSGICVSSEWRIALITYAETFIELQHSQRLVAFALRSEADNFHKELETASLNKEDAERYPDWLLIQDQIQGNFIIRAIQSSVAKEMISPSSSSNTILQLNMGEGKSHVIVPIASVALANSSKLVRVVVLKPLARQMFQLLVERICGIVNRRVFYLPFSRDVKMGLEQFQHIRQIFEECISVRGILVAQPEHILSFRLMVIERILASRHPLDNAAKELFGIQQLLRTASRDILDESDELLHVRYQLIYTMKEQRPLDDSPDRWISIQQIFDVINKVIKDIKERYPFEVDLSGFDGRQPFIGAFRECRLLGTAAADRLNNRIAEAVLDGAIDSFNLAGLSTRPQLRGALLEFIKLKVVDEQTRHLVESEYRGTGHWKALLLFRGLIGHGILAHVLGKHRWRVDYGLDLTRSLLAVPYRAKDMPSPRSEFGHPDVALCLTCLSYYYGGLNPVQVQECFTILLKLDNPIQEYEKWVKRGGKRIAASLRQLTGINTRDVQTFIEDVVPVFRYNQATIDFFLSRVVFPRVAKEFSHKLGTSGWDLAEEPVNGNFVTGFSGTNDNSELLPTSIAQRDPVNQLSTNAQVLSYLLGQENERYVCMANARGQPCTATEFLGLLVNEPEEVQVLLDVGAQMLELTNLELVKHWLTLRKDVAAGIFVDDEDQLSVLSQDGIIEPLYSSPFSKRLHQCVIYLDDAHTRGTDLKLPRNFRAAVTLGPRVTKDRLVQGCMRMRKLGHGQSIVFFAPPEIDRQIREAESIRDSRPVAVPHVLSWVMAQTCIDIEQRVPHWVQQGVDYYQRQNAYTAFLSSDAKDVRSLESAWLQPAQRTLDEMYGPPSTTWQQDLRVENIPAMQERLALLGIPITRHHVEMEEEQEREVSHEVEQELQLERPPYAEPCAHSVDPDIQFFIERGALPAKFSSILPLLKPLRSKAEHLDPEYPWSRSLLCTRDFMTTTTSRKETTRLTEYLRPVQWIISFRSSDRQEAAFVVVSPHEANALLPKIRGSQSVRLHMYSPRTTQAMRPMDNLLFYCVPPIPAASSSPISLNLRCQLNLWAGQLYFDSYNDYMQLCFLLGLSPEQKYDTEAMRSDGFVPPRGRTGKMRDICLFQSSPVSLVKALMGFRRKGMNFENTHLGKILHAKRLSEEEFEDEGE
ncbi:hypothetical protein CVT26_002576 [Gymnopilus dilepis]|uniref:ubiquitinyl hydrolase 1 n=1 Tax=Gymnopilus dilepis TaxID=231916 RepID=A0A409VF25_9AGAR|nr:hypothetical protein CVT26_002576 [Gymnopilus dilepis]